MAIGSTDGDGGGGRVSMVRCDARAAAAPKLEIGAARGGHLIFIAGKWLGAQGKGERRGRRGVLLGHELEEEEDTWLTRGPSMSATGERGKGRLRGSVGRLAC